MKPTIISYSWVLTESDGVTQYTSSLPNPIFQLDSGIYDVTLTVQTSDGEYTVTETEYVVISDYDLGQLNPYYINDPKSYTYGMNNISGYGWSENTGDHFVRPLSKASIIKKIVNGEEVTIVRDMIDKKQYIINVGETSAHSAVYNDKDMYPVESTIRTQKMAGNMASDLLQHEQTTVKFKDINDGKDLPDDFEITANIYNERDGEPIDTTIKPNPSDEITFYYQTRAEETSFDRYIELKTNTTQFQLFDIESIFKRTRKFRSASSNTQRYYDLINTSTIHWFTRGDYERDLGTGRLLFYVDGITGDKTYLDLSNAPRGNGPDGRVNSSIKYDQNVNIKNNDETDVTLMLWSSFKISDIGGLALTDVGSKNGWYLYYYTGSITADFEIPEFYSLFDFRILSFNIDNEDDKDLILEEYFSNIERFLPTY